MSAHQGETDAVRYSVDGGVARLTLNRPTKRNALDLSAMVLLGERISQAVADSAVGCIVLDGADGSFCSGADLGADIDAIIDGAGEMMAAVRRVVTTLVQAPQPVIAA